jgi:outer membrane protein
MPTLFIIIMFLVPAFACAADLTEALSDAYVNHPKLISDREDLKYMAQETSKALGGFLPNVQWSRSRQKNKNYGESFGNSAPITQKTTTIQNQLQIQQELFRGGMSVASMKVARKNFELAIQNLKIAEQKFMSEAISAYLNTLYSQEMVDIANNNVEFRDKTYLMSSKQFQHGQLTVTDLEKSKAELARAQSLKIEANGNYLKAKAKYVLFFGKDPVDLKVPAYPTSIAQNVDELIEQAKISNPEILAAKKEAELYSNNVWVVTAQRISPSLVLQGTTADISTKPKDPFRVYSRKQNSLTLNLTVPIYQGGGEYAEIRQSKIKSQQAQSKAFFAASKVVETAVEAWEAFNSNNAIITSSEQMMISNTKVLAGTRKEYAVGERVLAEVLNAEQKFFESRSDLAMAKYQTLSAAYAIYASVGKLTAQGLALPVEYFNAELYYNKAWNFIPHLSTK